MFVRFVLGAEIEMREVANLFDTREYMRESDGKWVTVLLVETNGFKG